MRSLYSLGKILPYAATLAIAFILALPSAPARAAELKQARISQVVKDVKLLPGQAAPRPANVSDEVRDNTAVRTGAESRAELTFSDATLARLGANTIFSFNEGTRNLELGGGAMLLRVPKNAGGAKINTAAITAAITGTTIMLEYHPDAYIKFIVLEGTGRIFRNNRIGESVLLHAGQMLILNPNGEGLPDPVDVDIERILRTSLLINGFRPLPSNDLIAREIQLQLEKKSEGELIDTNLVIFGRGTAVTLLDPTYSAIIDQAKRNESPTPTPEPTITPTPTPTPTMTATPTPTMTATPTPTPSATPIKFGALATITSPDPYIITSGTVINTDPTITTNGQTDLGKIYRGPELDGSPSQYFFGSTSTFDTDSGFEDHFSATGNSPIAAFKFSSLLLAGDPTVIIPPGEATKLALISVGDMFGGTAMTTLTFAGIDSLLLATQNGSITFGNNLTFQNIPSLFVYARGKNSTLTFDAGVTGTKNLVLVSENNLVITASDITETGAAGDDLNVYFFAGSNLTLNGAASFQLLNDGGSANSADISIGANGIINAAAVTASIQNSGGVISNEASIGFFGGPSVSTDELNFLINNNDGGSIGSLASIFLGAQGDLSVNGNVFMTILGLDTNGGPSTFGEISLIVAAANVSIGNSLVSLFQLNAGGSSGFVSNGLFLTGDFTSGGDLNLEIDNGATGGNGSLGGGGTIDGNATVSFSGQNVSVGGRVEETIYNVDGGAINGDALVSFSAGNVTTGPVLEAEIVNSIVAGDTGGTITGNAVISIAGVDFAVGGQVFDQIDNFSGVIQGDASILFNSSGAVSSLSTSFSIINDTGTIGGDILIDVTAASMSADGTISAFISNFLGNALGNKSILVTVTGALTAGTADFSIFDTPLTISAGPCVDSISVTVGSIAITSSLSASINVGADNPVFLTDNVSISAAQDVTVGGQINVFGSLSAGGNITAAGTILIGGGNLIATGNITSTGGDIVLQRSFDGIGTITAGGSINTHNLTAPGAQAGANITIGNTVGGPFSIVANTLTAGGAINLINVSLISGFSSTFGPNGGFTSDPFTLTANSVNVVGPSIPALTFNGSDGGSSDPGNGGSVTLNLTADNLTIGNIGDFTSITANGGAFAVNGSSGGGNGGTVNITTSGDVTVNDAGISADSGANPTGTPAGAGGTVNITSGGAVNVNSVIQTSGNGSGGSNSAKGGNINLTSSRAAGIAINVNNTGQLLALLDQAAPGPGGKITILASGGGGSSVQVNGGVQADRGTVDIRHTGANGTVNLSDATGNNTVTLHGDVVKVGALGANGTLTIGQGSLSADSVLKLYAPSSNGTLNFVANVTLSSGTDAILAANTITIQPSVVVNVQGNGGPAQVFTNNPNYNGFGGTNPSNGTFGGNGANNPLPLNQAPPFDGPPGG